MARESNIRDKIVSYISSHPRATRTQIATDLNIHYTTVQKHLKSLERKKELEERLYLTGKMEERYLKFWIFIQTKYPSRSEYQEANLNPDLGAKDFQGYLCSRIAKHLYSFDEKTKQSMIFLGIEVVMGGRHDIVLSLNSSNDEIVSEFVTQYLRIQPEVESTATSWRLPFNIDSFNGDG